MPLQILEFLDSFREKSEPESEIVSRLIVETDVGKVSPGKSRSSQKKLARAFFEQPADKLARALIGKILVRSVDGEELRARVTETEAYLGPADLASHASKGRTRRTEVMFGPPGHAYVYLIYGLHHMLNVVAGIPGEAHAVLIRAANPLGSWKADLSGPGRLGRSLRITLQDNGLDLTGNELHFLETPGDQPNLKITKRIGIDYAGEWKDAPLRFLETDRST